MSIYTRPVVIEATQVAAINKAYRTAGVTIPTRAVAVQELVNNEPTAKQVTREIAAEALTATDPEGFYKEALSLIQRAHAADALRSAFGPAIAEATRNTMPGLLKQAAADLSPAFNKLSAAFAAAAKNLPATDPLNPDSAIETDTTRELKAARSALMELATYAGIYPQGIPQGVPVAIMALLPIVALPTCVAEVVSNTPYEPAPVLNKPKLNGTYAVRKLGHDAREDVDAALIGVAAGRYPGVTLSLATPEELQTRRENAEQAQRRIKSTDTTGKLISV